MKNENWKMKNEKLLNTTSKNEQLFKIQMRVNLFLFLSFLNFNKYCTSI